MGARFRDFVLDLAVVPHPYLNSQLRASLGVTWKSSDRSPIPWRQNGMARLTVIPITLLGELYASGMRMTMAQCHFLHN